MKTKEFFTQLKKYSDLPLLFEYQPGKYISPSYHITEIKKTHVDSVDCGANSHSFDQTVVQLWLGENEPGANYMSAGKAKRIFDIVQTKASLLEDAEILFEYGDTHHPVIVYPVGRVAVENDRLIVHLELPQTACKPKLALAKAADALGMSCC